MAELHYRRRRGRWDVWHFCRNCTTWPRPSETYDQRFTKPPPAELCTECVDKQFAGNCETG